LHTLSVSMGWKCRSWPTHFSAHNFLSVNILSSVTAAYFVFFCMIQIVTCFYTVEQGSAINNLNIASALQLSKSDLCNLKFCVTFVSMQKLLSPIWMLMLPVMPFTLTLFRYYCIIANFAKDFSWISRIGNRTIGFEPTFEFWTLQPYMSKLLAALVYQEVFLPEITTY